MASDYFVRLRPNGKVQGPFTPAQLGTFAAAGKISGATEVSPDRVSWTSYNAFQEAAEAKPKVSPPPEASPVLAGVLLESNSAATATADPPMVRITEEPAAAPAPLPPPSQGGSPLGNGPLRVKPAVKEIAASAVTVGASLAAMAVRAKQAVDTKADEAAQRIEKRSDGEPYGVFISYRRGAGAEMSRWLTEKLEQHGYRAFVDVDGLGAGDWHEGLRQAITQSTNFIVIVTDGFFARCGQEDDVVRKEIALAISESKNVIPLIVSDSPFPADLPEDIASIARMNGVRYRHEHADSAFSQLCSMLQGDSSWLRLERGDPGPRKVLTIVAAVIGVLAGAQVYGSASYGVSLMSLPMMLAMDAFVIIVLFTPLALLVHTLVVIFLGRSQEQSYAGKRWCVFWLTYSPMIALPCLLISTAATALAAAVFNLMGVHPEYYGGEVSPSSFLSLVRTAVMLLLSFGVAVWTALLAARVVIKSGAWKSVKKTFSILK